MACGETHRPRMGLPPLTNCHLTHTEVVMAANRQQGSYLAVFLIAFMALPAGLVALSNHPVIGGVLVVTALALLAQAAVGYRRIRPFEFSDKG